LAPCQQLFFSFSSYFRAGPTRRPERLRNRRGEQCGTAFCVLTLRCQFKNARGGSLLEFDITGKVRFFDGNRNATYYFAKKAASAAAENFASRK